MVGAGEAGAATGDGRHLPDLRDFVRADRPSSDATMVVRGGPDSPEKLGANATRTGRAFVLDGAPVLGVSVFAALDDIGPDSFDGICAGRLSTYRVVHLARVSRLMEAGFELMPTFARPHMTLLLDDLDQADLLMKALGRPQANPQYRDMTRRTRRRPR